MSPAEAAIRMSGIAPYPKAPLTRAVRAGRSGYQAAAIATQVPYTSPVPRPQATP